MPFDPLGLRTAVGEVFRLPGDMVLDRRDGLGETGSLRLVRKTVFRLKPSPSSHNTQPVVHAPGELEVWNHVLVMPDALWKTLQPPYEGPISSSECGARVQSRRQ